MTLNNIATMPSAFPSWIKLAPGRGGPASGTGATIVFPHAGAAAGADTYVVQYPQRAERLGDPPTRACMIWPPACSGPRPGPEWRR